MEIDMIIYPAIDLREGRAVRLLKGDYNQMTVYSDSPAETAISFRKKGADHLHVVDLDGAKDGRAANYSTIKSILDSVPDMFVEVGGGIRDEERIKKYLDAGVKRVILGSAAIEDPAFTEKMSMKYALDVMVAIHGWKTVTGERSTDLCERMRNIGIGTVIYTDISRDGTLSGTNLEIYSQLSELDIDIIASGGITFEHEIGTLAGYGIHGAILGKALYAGKLDLERCIRIAGGDPDAC